ncbi:MAG TPA: hypothetical protein VFX16_20160 [Pseudonocardiaceae bacterium]|nr:hypothetical protein [Pseudonocardiaceae bacterium]
MTRPLSATLALADAMRAHVGDQSAPRTAEPVGLPLIDEHLIRIAAPRDRVWTALRRYADSSLRLPEPLGRLPHIDPVRGFDVAQEIPNRHLSMDGRHRFARYQLGFDLDDLTGGTTLLSARTYATFQVRRAVPTAHWSSAAGDMSSRCGTCRTPCAG